MTLPTEHTDKLLTYEHSQSWLWVMLLSDCPQPHCMPWHYTAPPDTVSIHTLIQLSLNFLFWSTKGAQYIYAEKCNGVVIEKKILSLFVAYEVRNAIASLLVACWFIVPQSYDSKRSTLKWNSVIFTYSSNPCKVFYHWLISPCLPASLPPCLPASLPPSLPHFLSLCIPAFLPISPSPSHPLSPSLPPSLPPCLLAFRSTSLPLCLLPFLFASFPASLPPSVPPYLPPRLPPNKPNNQPNNHPARKERAPKKQQ